MHVHERIRDAVGRQRSILAQGLEMQHDTWRLMVKVALKSRSMDQIHRLLTLMQREDVMLTDTESDLMFDRLQMLQDGRYGEAASQALADTRNVASAKLPASVR